MFQFFFWCPNWVSGWPALQDLQGLQEAQKHKYLDLAVEVSGPISAKIIIQPPFAISPKVAMWPEPVPVLQLEAQCLHLLVERLWEKPWMVMWLIWASKSPKPKPPVQMGTGLSTAHRTTRRQQVIQMQSSCRKTSKCFLSGNLW